MMRRKTLFYLAALGICAAVFSGCQSSVQTQEELVTPKTEVTEDQAVTGKETFGEQQNGQTNEKGDNVASQVQAPQRYQTEIKSENIVINADAEFEIPDVPGIKTKKVRPRFFTQEDYDTVNEVLLDGGKLWDRDYEAMAATHGFTLSELNKRLEMFENEKANGVDGDAPYGDTDRTLNDRIEETKILIKAAEAEKITEPVINEIPAVVEQNGNSGDNSDWGQLSGFVTAQENDYDVYMLNHMDKEWMWTSFSVEKNMGKGNYLYYGDDLKSYEDMEITKEKFENIQIQPEEILAKAGKALDQMKMKDFTVQGGEYFACYKPKKIYGVAKADVEETEIDKVAYGAHVIRIVDGVPVNYTHQNGNNSAGDESVCWPYEEMTFIYDEDGLVSFYWSDPYELEDLSAEYVFLLPFSDIRNIFEEMIIKKEKDNFIEEGDSLEINIDKVCLNYMRIREKNSTEGTLIPVWDFFGTQIYKSNGQVSYIQNSVYESIFTINAMDGTIIDRNFGY